MKKLPILLLLALCACAPKAKTYLWNEADATVDRAVYDEQYKLNQAEWDAVFAWLAKPETKTLPAGRYEITDQTYATVQIDSNVKVSSGVGNVQRLHYDVLEGIVREIYCQFFSVDRDVAFA